MIHLDEKPLVGGTPTTDRPAMANMHRVKGILRPMPPRSSRLSAWVANITAPQTRKSRSLKNTWLITCSMPPA